HCTLLYCRREDTRHALQGVRELSLLRGKPVLLLSDRAAYFRSAEWTRSLRQQGIRAIHTASRAPWEGAVYERLNLEIRRMLKHVADIPKVQKLLKKFDPQSVNDTHSLRMMLLEIELLCNTRPIGMSTGSSLTDDFMEVISPDRLAYGFQRRLDDYTRPVPLTAPLSPTDSDDEVGTGVEKVLQAAARRSGGEGILPDLSLKDRSSRQCNSPGQKSATQLCVGDAVFVKNDKQIFGARVLELLPGKDEM
ncbi:hypothetical protein FOZ62_012620, partial [Perkinsus olseni]